MLAVRQANSHLFEQYVWPCTRLVDEPLLSTNAVAASTERTETAAASESHGCHVVGGGPDGCANVSTLLRWSIGPAVGPNGINEPHMAAAWEAYLRGYREHRPLDAEKLAAIPAFVASS
jgi:hypothetical protein